MVFNLLLKEERLIENKKKIDLFYLFYYKYKSHFWFSTLDLEFKVVFFEV